jgi:hypothetical protein
MTHIFCTVVKAEEGERALQSRQVLGRELAAPVQLSGKKQSQPSTAAGYV